MEQAHLVSDHEEGKKRIQQAIDDRSGFEKLCALFHAQGGDVSDLRNPEKFAKASYEITVRAQQTGYVKRIDSLGIGISAMKLGAGRAKMDDVIDMSAGILLNKKVGDFVRKGDVLATCYTNKGDVESVLKDAAEVSRIDHPGGWYAQSGL